MPQSKADSVSSSTSLSCDLKSVLRNLPGSPNFVQDELRLVFMRLFFKKAGLCFRREFKHQIHKPRRACGRAGEFEAWFLVFSKKNPHHCYLCNLGGMRQSKADTVPPIPTLRCFDLSVLRNLPGSPNFVQDELRLAFMRHFFKKARLCFRGEFKHQIHKPRRACGRAGDFEAGFLVFSKKTLITVTSATLEVCGRARRIAFLQGLSSTVF